MKRTEQKQNTRARVLRAAKRCIANRDVRDVSMQEIARRAKVSVGALYVHFDGRDALIDGTIDELQLGLLDRFGAALLAIDDPSTAAAIRRLAVSYVAAFDELRPFVSLYASHVARSTSTEVLRGGGAAAPLVQMVNATLGSLRLERTSVDRPFLAAALVSLWRAAALSQTARPAWRQRQRQRDNSLRGRRQRPTGGLGSGAREERIRRRDPEALQRRFRTSWKGDVHRSRRRKGPCNGLEERERHVLTHRADPILVRLGDRRQADGHVRRQVRPGPQVRERFDRQRADVQLSPVEPVVT